MSAGSRLHDLLHPGWLKPFPDGRAAVVELEPRDANRPVANATDRMVATALAAFCIARVWIEASNRPLPTRIRLAIKGNDLHRRLMVGGALPEAAFVLVLVADEDVTSGRYDGIVASCDNESSSQCQLVFAVPDVVRSECGGLATLRRLQPRVTEPRAVVAVAFSSPAGGSTTGHSGTPAALDITAAADIVDLAAGVFAAYIERTGLAHIHAETGELLSASDRASRRQGVGQAVWLLLSSIGRDDKRDPGAYVRGGKAIAEQYTFLRDLYAGHGLPSLKALALFDSEVRTALKADGLGNPALDQIVARLTEADAELRALHGLIVFRLLGLGLRCVSALSEARETDSLCSWRFSRRSLSHGAGLRQRTTGRWWPELARPCRPRPFLPEDYAPGSTEMAEIVRMVASTRLTFAGTVGDVLAFQVLHRLLRASPISWWTEFSSDAPQSAPLALALVECVARMDGAVDDDAGGTARAAMATWSIDVILGSARDGAGQRWRLRASNGCRHTGALRRSVRRRVVREWRGGFPS